MKANSLSIFTRVKKANINSVFPMY